MNPHILFAGLMTATFSCGAALACPPSESGHHHGKLETIAAPQQKLHDALKLSPEQESAWQVLQEHNSAREEKHHQEMRELMERHQQDRTESEAEFQSFYEKLSPQQQKTLGQQLRQHHDDCAPKKPSETNKK